GKIFARYDELNCLKLKEVVVNQVAHGQVEFTVRLRLFQQIQVDRILPQRGIKLADERPTEEAFDLDNNLASGFDGGNWALGSQVGLQFQVFILDVKRVVGNRPAIFGERVLYGIVDEIFGHN